MNKQEFQQTIKNMKCKKDCVYMSSFEVFKKGFEKAKELVLLHSNSLDEPEKPIVPEFVVIWYEDNRDDFEFNLYRLCVDYENCELDTEMMIWFRDKHNNPIQTLTAMHQVGYEVKREERLYTVEFPQTDSDSHILLRRRADGRVGLDLNYDDNWATYSTYWLTEDEIKKDFNWAWKFAKVVK